MEILRLAGLALVGALTALLLKNSKGEYSLVIGLAMTFLVCGYVIINLTEVVAAVSGVWERALGNQQFLQILLRIVGITYVSDLTADLCKECGYPALSGQVIVAGKMGVLLTGFPIFMSLLEFVLQLGGE